MTISFHCPHCSHPSTAPPALAGQWIRCLVCQQAFKVPLDSPLPPPLPAPYPSSPFVVVEHATASRACGRASTSNQLPRPRLHWLTKALACGWLVIAALVFLPLAVSVSVQTKTVLVPVITALGFVLLYTILTAPPTFVGLVVLHFGLKPGPAGSSSLKHVLTGLGGVIASLGYLLSLAFMIWSARAATGTFHPPDHPTEKAKLIARYERKVKDNLKRAQDALPEVRSAIGTARKDRWMSSSQKRQIRDRGERIASEYIDAIRDLDYYWRKLDESVQDLEVHSQVRDDPQVQDDVAEQLAWLQKYEELTSDPEKRFEIWLESLKD